MSLAAPSVRSQQLSHFVTAAIAAAAAAIVQVNWTTAMTARGTEGWRLFVVAVLLTATAWLGSSAWLHWRLAQSLDEDPIERLTRLAMNGFSDLLVMILAGVSLYRGPDSRVLLAGLSLVPPCLMAVAAASIVVLALAGIAAWQRRHAAEDRGDMPPRARDRWRTAIVVALFIAFGLLSSRPLPGEPQSQSGHGLGKGSARLPSATQPPA